jgi:stage II sporulation protein D
LKPVLLLALASLALCRAQVTYKVQLTQAEGGAIVELAAEKYVAAVLAAEAGTLRSQEARKAIAIAARTYAARLRGRHAAEGFDFCATTHCQRADLHGATPDLLRTALATAGELLWLDGKPAFTVYSRDCGGQTAAVGDLWPDIPAPYLLTHPDPYCIRHRAAAWSWTASTSEIAAALRASKLNVPDKLDRIVITERTPSQRARTLELIGPDRRLALSAGSLRLSVGRTLGWNKLRSDRYEIDNRIGQICFRGTGEGHGIGLCQRGADEMGLQGRSYRDILAFYYPRTTLSLMAAASMHWNQLTSESIKLLSTDPHRDRALLPISEALLRAVPAQLPIAHVTIRVYPDLDTFRNATSEPGWVAAHTFGSTIDLQPPAILQSRGILRSTLRHEFLHVAVETNAATALPVWFREGLVGYLAGERTTAPVVPAQVSDADLAQRDDPTRAQAAYAQARGRVATLVRRYGESAVVGWVKRGLPADVTNSTASSANTNSR